MKNKPPNPLVPDIDELAAIQHNTRMANLHFGAQSALVVAVILAFAQCWFAMGSSLVLAVWLECYADKKARLWREYLEDKVYRKEESNGEA